MHELNKILSRHVDEGKFPGIQWQINIKNEIYSGKYGYNNIENKLPVLDNTIYRIWSMTKPIVAVVALQLLEQNKIKLDDPITEYLPEFSNLKVLKSLNSPIDDVVDLIADKINSFDILVTQGAGSISKICELIKDKWKK